MSIGSLYSGGSVQQVTYINRPTANMSSRHALHKRRQFIKATPPAGRKQHMRWPAINNTVNRYASIPRKYSIRIRESDLPLGEIGEPKYDGIHFDKRLFVVEVEKSAKGLTKLEHAADGALDSKAGSSESDMSSSASSSTSTIGSANGEVHLNPNSD